VDHKTEVENLLRESEARTGQRVSFFVAHSQKVGYVVITVVLNSGADHTFEADLHAGLTPANAQMILNWFETLAAGNA
jgi:hypothetical protein